MPVPEQQQQQTTPEPSIDDIIGATIKDLDAGGDGSAMPESKAGGGDDGGAGTPPPTETGEKPPTTPELKDDDPFATEHNIKVFDQRKRENRIPYSNVKSITSNAVKKRVMEIAKLVLGKDPELAKHKDAVEQLVEAIKARVTGFGTIETEHATYKKNQAEYDAIGKVMTEQPERFLQLLPTINAKYADLLKKEVRAAAADPDSEKPKPDLDMGGGKMTYSPEGLVKLVAWEVANGIKADRAERDKELKPLKDKAAADAQIASAQDRLGKMIDHARKAWPGFKENEAAILKSINDGKANSLQAGYILWKDEAHKAEIAKYTTDEAAMRKKILDEMKGTPSSTSAGGGSTQQKPKSAEELAAEQEQEEDPVSAAIRETIRELDKK